MVATVGNKSWRVCVPGDFSKVNRHQSKNSRGYFWGYLLFFISKNLVSMRVAEDDVNDSVPPE